ncbi:SDR family NAD(P)-dependent oxidoreductase [Salibacterium halotolerans]|uniref:NAD(P)-dependent dehydrogenase, short-chain alcohol dehydrogenase family n=1 Tax=Salibacterium halotolerans TaxID=1884432 RepID=A0A1I5U0F8_9BACI|nr:SDR family NAD(P)-dependent oxidoreductase [Salibacterium halotolerans]SFP88800.1 NAD(P)-dependent dehydrogenase, short-chain alcohol dehydrogenase family [Salibacterium halotolerans]
MSYEGKSVIVTGAAGGIGSAFAKMVAAEGAKLTLVDMNQEALERTAEALDHEDVQVVAADVTKEEDTAHYVQQAKEVYGSVDVFVNNAGINGEFANLQDQTMENLENVLGVNVKGVFAGLKYVMKEMTAQGSGAIVNLASNGGLLGAPGMGPYVASKHAVVGLTKTAALEGADHGVRVNAVAPSGVDTQMMRSIESNASPDDTASARSQFEASVPMNRYAEPEEIADLIHFLGSERASFISGTYYRIDGAQGATSV